MSIQRIAAPRFKAGGDDEVNSAAACKRFLTAALQGWRMERTIFVIVATIIAVIALVLLLSMTIRLLG
jgi:hypothetical protein